MSRKKPPTDPPPSDPPGTSATDAGSTGHARARRRTRSGKGEKGLAKLSVQAQQERFLRQFASIGNVTDAAKLAGVDRTRHYVWLDEPEKYPDYEARFLAAKEEALDRMRREIRRRGVVGWEEPVFGSRVDANGKNLGTGVVGHKLVYSDRMLELAARIWLPEARERVEVTGKDGGPIQTENLSALTDEQVEARLQAAMRILGATVAAPRAPEPRVIEGEARPADPEARYEEALKRRNGGGEK